MKTISNTLFVTATLIPAIDAFTHYPSSFTGSASSVCSRAELTTELSCPPASLAFNKHRGRNLGMPPFLKKLGLKKPEKPVFGGDEGKESTSDTGTAVLTRDDEEQKEETTNKDDVNGKATIEIQEEAKEMSESEKLLKQVKESGTAGIISYALWELGFWALSVPVCIFAYYQLVGHMPDLSSSEDLSKLGGEAFAFVNFARFAVPLRIGLALSTTPWIQDNIVDKFMKKEGEEMV